MRNKFERVKKTIDEGTCETFNIWKQYGTTEKDFIADCEWLCADPFDERGRTTRGLGVERDGTTKRLFVNRGLVSAWYEMPGKGSQLGTLWGGKPYITSTDRI